MIELVGRKSVITVDCDAPDAEYVRHRGRLYAATADRNVWELTEDEPPQGARIADVDPRAI